MNTMQAPCAVKVARTVLGGGKAGDDIKGLPIAIERISFILKNALNFMVFHLLMVPKAMLICAICLALKMFTPQTITQA